MSTAHSKLPLILAGLLCLASQSAPAASGGPRLMDLNIEQLLDLQVTSASRKKQSLSETAAAVFVISRDDIRRSGARSIPEALRMAPGLQVAQIDANKWAISARGFMGLFANKLLVMMDGRTLYTSSYSGVFWDAQNTLIDNIERIEVIRGPGGTMWGANAVNGIINIITRDARDLRGGLASASHDDRDSYDAALRFGGGDEALAYSAFVKYDDTDGNRDVAGNRVADGWHQARGGLRVDWQSPAGDAVTMSAEAYSGRAGDSLMLGSLTPPYLRRVDGKEHMSGGFLLGRWMREWSTGRETSVQLAIDVTRRDTLMLGEDRDAFELEAQHRFAVGQHNDFIAGLSFHRDSLDFKNGVPIQIVPRSPADSRLGAFLQDEIALADGRVLLTLGSKLEHNQLSDAAVDILPNARLAWRLADAHHVWGAVTRSVRIPSHADLHATVTGLGAIGVLPPLTARNPLPLPIQTQVRGSDSFVSEKLTAFELGYRGQLAAKLSLDAALFLNRYSDLRSVKATGLYCSSTGEPVNPAAPPMCLFTSTSLLAPLSIGNDIKLETYGAEVSLDWRPTSLLRLVGSYSHLHVHEQSLISAFDENVAGQSLRNQLSLRSELAFGPTVDVGLWLRYSDKLSSGPVDAHWNGDVRLAWRPREGLELTLVGRNLLHRAQLEFISEMKEVVPTEIERSVAGAVRWSF